MMISKPARNI